MIRFRRSGRTERGVSFLGGGFPRPGRGGLIEEVLSPAFPGCGVQGAIAGTGVLFDHMGAEPISGGADMLGRLFQGSGQGGGGIMSHRCFHGVFPYGAGW